MADRSEVILLVTTDDGLDTYYNIDSSYIMTLIRIHNKGFGFYANGIFSDNGLTDVDHGLNNFLDKFYHYNGGRWKDIATKIKTIKHFPGLGCVATDPHDYHVFLHH
ncbi:Hypothetical protein HVR_LOCUS787 [uncultured virus]|nr:Hypothetical protein HVR_LOCUS787 [uncultured virus]